MSQTAQTSLTSPKAVNRPIQFNYFKPNALQLAGNTAPRRPLARMHKMHKQHFRWSYYINRSSK